MSELIDWVELADTNQILSWFIVACAGTNGDVFDENFDSSKLDIQMTINGYEVSLIDVFSDLGEEVHNNIKKAKSTGFKKG